MPRDEFIPPNDMQIDRARRLFESLPLNTGDEEHDDLTVLAAGLAQLEAEIRMSIGGNHPPEDTTLLPESLIDPAAIGPLLTANYGPLIARGAELLQMARDWQADNKPLE